MGCRLAGWHAGSLSLLGACGAGVPAPLRRRRASLRRLPWAGLAGRAWFPCARSAAPPDLVLPGGTAASMYRLQHYSELGMPAQARLLMEQAEQQGGSAAAGMLDSLRGTMGSLVSRVQAQGGGGGGAR